MSNDPFQRFPGESTAAYAARVCNLIGHIVGIVHVEAGLLIDIDEVLADLEWIIAQPQYDKRILTPCRGDGAVRHEASNILRRFIRIAAQLDPTELRHLTNAARTLRPEDLRLLAWEVHEGSIRKPEPLVAVVIPQAIPHDRIAMILPTSCGDWGARSFATAVPMPIPCSSMRAIGWDGRHDRR